MVLYYLVLSIGQSDCQPNKQNCKEVLHWIFNGGWLFIHYLKALFIFLLNLADQECCHFSLMLYWFDDIFIFWCTPIIACLDARIKTKFYGETKSFQVCEANLKNPIILRGKWFIDVFCGCCVEDSLIMIGYLISASFTHWWSIQMEKCMLSYVNI